MNIKDKLDKFVKSMEIPKVEHLVFTANAPTHYDNSKGSIYQFCDNQKPEQYQIGIDTFKRSESNQTLSERLGVARFLIDKYTWRKKDQERMDFIKIIDYANWAIKQIDNEEEINRLNP